MTGAPGRGDPAPWFYAPTCTNPRYAFDSVGGRQVVLFFFGSAGRPEAMRALREFRRLAGVFDDVGAAFFGISNDPVDRSSGRVRQQLPGYRYFWDLDRRIAALYGVAAPAAAAQAPLTAFVLNPGLQIVERIAEADPTALVERVSGLLLRLLAEEQPLHAPVLVVPRVFDDVFCHRLIALYDETGGKDSGFMRDVGGRTVGIVDHRHKRRSDCEIEPEALRRQINESIHRRLVPLIRRAFQFDATRIERYIVACYDAGVGGYFRPHRDNTTRGTAHRRFAVTINLNAEAYEGGDLRFPEFGPRTYRAPTGGAVVFSCSLLHEATPVTRGRRYACLPFLYDEAAAAARRTYLASLAEDSAGAAPSSAAALGAAEG